MSVTSFLRRELLVLPGDGSTNTFQFVPTINIFRLYIFQGILLCAAFYLSRNLLLFHGRNWHGFDICIIGRALGVLVCAPNSFTWPARKCYMLFGTVSAILSTMIFLLDSRYITISGHLEDILVQTMLLACEFSFGFLNIILICHIADNITKNYRGSIATNIPIGIYGLSALADIIYVKLFTSNSFELIPAISILFSVGSIVLTCCFTYDPVTYLLQFNAKTKAEQVFQNSNKGGATPTDLQFEIDEMDKAIQDENSTGLRCYLDIFSNGNWKPLAMISLLFILHTVAFRTINIIFIKHQTHIIYPTEYKIIHVAALVSCKFLIDLIGRKPLFWLSGMCFVVASFLRISQCFAENNFGSYNVQILVSCIAFGSLWLGVEPLTYVYLCESFPLTKRNMSIAYVTIVNLGINMILPWIWIVDNNLWYATSAMLVLVAVLGFFLPETKHLSLRESRNRCNTDWLYIQPYPTAPQWTA